tara:strand:- start:57779 stop:58357 length:579 start_codon:yes stop_codon:yes gene_type:complete
MLAVIKGFFTGKKMIVYAVIGIVVLGIWGAMKYDNAIIRTLQGDLTEAQAERDSAVIDAEINDEVRTIDDETLKDQLEREDQVDDQTRGATEDLDNEIDRILKDIESQTEQPDDDAPVDQPTQNEEQAIEETEPPVVDNGDKEDVGTTNERRNEEKDTGYTSAVDDRVAGAAIDRMWDYYCNSVEDEASCTQ